MKKKTNNNLIYLGGFIIIAALIYTFLGKADVKTDKVPISKVAEEIKEDRVKSIKVEGGSIEVTLKDDKKQTSDISRGESITTVLKDFGADPAKISSLEIKSQKTKETGQ